MKAKSYNYLFVLRTPSSAAALHAWKSARELNLRVLGQGSDRSLEILANPQEAEALFDTGLFILYTRRAIVPTHGRELDDELAAIVSTWNRRFAASYKERKRNLEMRGRPWQGNGRKEPAPYSVAEPSTLIARALEIRNKMRLPLDRKRAKPALKVDLIKAPLKDQRRVRKFFEKRSKTPRIADELFGLFYRANKAERMLLLDPEWLDLVLDILPQEAGADEPSCLKMHGRNSVGIVFVESSRSKGPKFTATQRNEIENEIRSGLSFLVGAHPSGNLVWVYDVQRVKIDVANTPNGDAVNSGADAAWRNPAMAKVEFEGQTFTGNTAGIDAFRAAMRAHHDSQHATVVFVTAFGLSWHAYSSGRRFIALGEHGDDWGHWGQDELNITMAHEMSHQFGAADEYLGGGTPCDSCWGERGCDNVPNGNCEKCAEPSQDCIMSSHDLRVCPYTRGQIGWADIFVELWTSNDSWAGTDDHVELDIGNQTFTLDNPNHNDRERGNREGHAVWAGGNLSRSSIKRILIRKGPDGTAGGWKLQRVRVMHKGDEICDESPNIWLEDRKTWFVAKEFDSSLVHRLRLRVRTADVSLAGTDDDVTLKLAGHSWNIDSDENDFERGSSRSYDLDPHTGLHTTNLKTITIKKSPDGAFGGWKLGGLKLTVNGNVIYDKNNINVWLEDGDRTFSDEI